MQHELTKLSLGFDISFKIALLRDRGGRCWFAANGQGSSVIGMRGCIPAAAERRRNWRLMAYRIAIQLSLILLIGVNIRPFFAHWQKQDGSVYIESWKKGEKQIAEQSLDVVLTVTKPDFKATISDSFKRGKYYFIINHQPIEIGDDKYDAWRVKLLDPKESEINLFRKTKPENWQHVFNKEDNIGWIFPVEDPDYLKYGVLAYQFSAKRIVKVESFYCAIQVIAYKRNSLNSKLLDSMTIHVEFSNKLNGRD